MLDPGSIVWVLVLGAAAVGVGAAGLVALLYSVLTYAVWLVERGQRGRSPLKGAGREWGQFQTSAAIEFLSSALLFLVHPFGAIDPLPPRERVLYGRRPVLLVHGYAQTRSNFALLAFRLASMGLGPLYAVNLRPYRASIRDHAALVSDRIDEILRTTGAQKIDIVAHSMGGLVARVAESMGERRRVRRLVTLGTPHRGTRMAFLAFGECGAEMREGSDFVKSLPPSPQGLIVAISSEHDNVIVPAENARIGDSGRNVVVSHVGHMSLLLNEQVAEIVGTSLGEDIQTTQDLLAAVSPEVATVRASSVRLAG